MLATSLELHDQKIAESARQEGIERGIEETAVKMLQENAEIPFISRITGIPEEKLMELKKNL